MRSGKEIKRIAAKVGLPIIRVHDLRLFHASILIEMCFSPLEIAERLNQFQRAVPLEEEFP